MSPALSETESDLLIPPASQDQAIDVAEAWIRGELPLDLAGSLRLRIETARRIVGR